MIKFSKEKVLLLHKLIAEETGGSIGVRDEALLESALENVFSGFGGQALELIYKYLGLGDGAAAEEPVVIVDEAPTEQEVTP